MYYLLENRLKCIAMDQKFNFPIQSLYLNWNIDSDGIFQVYLWIKIYLKQFSR